MEIPKMKVLIYVLTFLGYAWSGYGAGMLGNLRDAILAAEQVFGDVLENVITIARRFRDVHEVLDAAVEQNCKFTCPSAGVIPVKNKYHKPSSNGCGTDALKVEIVEYLPSADMTQCCNEHDICYDTCNSGKENCDFEFQRCLYRICDKTKGPETILKACKAAAKMMFTSTMTLGCKAYLESQKKACYCAPEKKKKFVPGGEF